MEFRVRELGVRFIMGGGERPRARRAGNGDRGDDPDGDG